MLRRLQDHITSVFLVLMLFTTLTYMVGAVWWLVGGCACLWGAFVFVLYATEEPNARQTRVR